MEIKVSGFGGQGIIRIGMILGKAAALNNNQSATLTYQLKGEAVTPGFEFDLPGPQTRSFDAGTYSIPSELTFTSSGSGSIWLHVTSPVDISSNHASFELSCTP